MTKGYNNEYKLNKEQEEAVESIDGPIMVIAGPGTGKTEIIAQRILNIIKKAVVPPSSVLALTFTNSGVRAMRKRLLKLIGPASSQVTISTFHSFGISLIQEFYEDLSYTKPPTLLPDNDTVVLFDELLENNEWEYLRLRNGGAQNFGDLKSIISLLKQDRMSSNDFLLEINNEIESIKNNPESISSKGPSKGKIKQKEKDRIESLTRTKEVAKFYELYEKTKKERGLVDYNDILENIVQLVKISENARDSIRERYLYVLVDEHQDSSGVQNEFLKEVWVDVEQPNVFVVGDDRQLIYGFGGASITHFEHFREVFRGTKTIALVENHRSTQNILDLAGTLLQSSLTNKVLKSVSKESNPVVLVEADFPRDEILKAGLEIKKKIEEGLSLNECAILVPKKAQVRSAVSVLEDLGLSVASGDKKSFFSLSETQSLITFLSVIADPYNTMHLSKVLLDPLFGVSFISAQKFLRDNHGRISLEAFAIASSEIQALGLLIQKFADELSKKDVYEIIQISAEELFFKKTTNHKELLLQIESVRTFLHLALQMIESNHKLSLESFLNFIKRMEEYNQDIPLAVFEGEEGVKVMTLHSSKGQEFDFVWIAHLDESSLMKGKKIGFTLPESLKEKVANKDEITAKRELYVGITRARRFCTLSYATTGYSGTDQYLAKIVSELPENLLIKKTKKETEAEILNEDKMVYVGKKPIHTEENIREEVIKFVQSEYKDKKVPVTHINNFFSCPWKWYFRNFLSLPEIESESLIFGNLVHKSIEKIISKGDSSSKSVLRIVEEVLDELYVYNEKLRTRLTKDGVSVLENFIKNDLVSYASAKSETKTNTYCDPQIPDIEVTGKIDIIQNLEDGTVSVTDFKTGRVKTKTEIEKKTEEGRMSDLLRQLSMYSYLLQNSREPLKVSISKLLFLEAEHNDKNRLYQKNISPEEIQLLRKDLIDYSSFLETGDWINRECDFKPFGVKKECEYCALAKKLSIY